MSKVERIVYSPREAAEALGVTRTTIYNWIDSGKIAAVKLSPKLVGISAAELRRFADTGETA